MSVLSGFILGIVVSVIFVIIALHIINTGVGLNW